MSDDNKILLTKQGLDELKRERDELINKKRPDLVTRLATARSQGDLTENSEYASAKEDLDFIDGRIAELDQVIHEAKVVSVRKREKIDIGCSVVLHMNGKKDTYTIVGEWEADPGQKKISHSSPLGKALMGKKPGDKVEVEAPAGRIVYKVVQIN